MFDLVIWWFGNKKKLAPAKITLDKIVKDNVTAVDS